MIALTVRTTVVTRLAAVVLLVLMMSPFAAPYSMLGSTLDITSLAAESAKNDQAPLDALVEPSMGLVVEALFPAAIPDVPSIFTTALTQTHQVLRL